MRKTQGQNALPSGIFWDAKFSKFWEPCTFPPFKFKLTSIAFCRRHNTSFVLFFSPHLKIDPVICRLNIPAFCRRVDGSSLAILRISRVRLPPFFLGRKVNRPFWASSDVMGPPLLSKESEAWKRSGGTPFFFSSNNLGRFKVQERRKRTVRLGVAKIYKSRSDSPWFFSRTPDFSSPRILQNTPNPQHHSKMFSKVLLVAATLVTFVAATPVPGGVDNSCNTGTLQCCNQTFSSTSGTATLLAALLNLNLSQLTGQIGLSCTPISVIGLGQGASCTQQPVCCSGNTYNGLINVGCSPINL